MSADDRHERELVLFLEPRLAPQWDIYEGLSVPTEHGVLHLAIQVVGPGRTVGIECETERPRAYEWSDALILAAGVADAIYHVPAELAELRPYDCLLVLTMAEVAMFSPHAQHEAERMATPRPGGGESDEPTMVVEGTTLGYRLSYAGKPAEDPRPCEIARSALGLERSRRNFLHTILEFARDHPGLSPDQLIARWFSRATAKVKA